jgi:hypothetical protein
MTHEVAVGLIERWLRGDASPNDWGVLAEHLRDCEDCRVQYQERRGRLLAAETRDASDPNLTAAEIDGLASLALARAASRKQHVPRRPVLARRRLAQMGMALGAAALLVAVLYQRGPGASDDGQDGLRALGSDGSAFGLQVVCFQRDNPNQYSLLKQSGHCPAGSYVKLQASSLDPSVREVSAVALSDDLRPLRVFQATLADSQPVTLGGYVELTEHRRIGVAFLFSAKPLSEGALRASVERAQKQGQTLTGLETLPLVAQATQKLLVVEAEEGP